MKNYLVVASNSKRIETR